jgi:hypothetical protein
METFSAAWAEFESATLLGKLGVVAIIISIMTPVVALVAWLMRRIVIRDLAIARKRVELLEQQVDNEKKDRKLQSSKALSLAKRLEEESPIEVLAMADKELTPNHNNQVRAVRIVEEGFLRIFESTYEICFRLAVHCGSFAQIDKSLSKPAWYFSEIALAIKDTGDIRFLRDGLRELDASLAEASGQFDPTAPEWNDYEFLPNLSRADEVRPLLRSLNDKISKLVREHKLFEAMRLVSRAGYIARVSLPPTDRFVVITQANAIGVLIGIGSFKEAASLAREVLSLMRGSKDPSYPEESMEVLQVRHLYAAAMAKSGDAAAATREAKDTADILEKVHGPEEFITIATRSIETNAEVMGKPDTPRMHFSNQGAAVVSGDHERDVAIEVTHHLDRILGQDHSVTKDAREVAERDQEE